MFDVMPFHCAWQPKQQQKCKRWKIVFTKTTKENLLWHENFEEEKAELYHAWSESISLFIVNVKWLKIVKNVFEDNTKCCDFGEVPGAYPVLCKKWGILMKNQRKVKGKFRSVLLCSAQHG